MSHRSRVRTDGEDHAQMVPYSADGQVSPYLENDDDDYDGEMIMGRGHDMVMRGFDDMMMGMSSLMGSMMSRFMGDGMMGRGSVFDISGFQDDGIGPVFSSQTMVTSFSSGQDGKPQYDYRSTSTVANPLTGMRESRHEHYNDYVERVGLDRQIGARGARQLHEKRRDEAQTENRHEEYFGMRADEAKEFDDEWHRRRDKELPVPPQVNLNALTSGASSSSRHLRQSTAPQFPSLLHQQQQQQLQQQQQHQQKQQKRQQEAIDNIPSASQPQASSQHHRPNPRETSGGRGSTNSRPQQRAHHRQHQQQQQQYGQADQGMGTSGFGGHAQARSAGMLPHPAAHLSAAPPGYVRPTGGHLGVPYQSPQYLSRPRFPPSGPPPGVMSGGVRYPPSVPYGPQMSYPPPQPETAAYRQARSSAYPTRGGPGVHYQHYPGGPSY